MFKQELKHVFDPDVDTEHLLPGSQDALYSIPLLVQVSLCEEIHQLLVRIFSTILSDCQVHCSPDICLNLLTTPGIILFRIGISGSQASTCMVTGKVFARATIRAT